MGTRVIAMRFSILSRNERILVRGAAILVLAGAAAGCSSQVARFGGGGVDDIFTASTPNQQQIIRQNQPYPGSMQAAPIASAETTPVTRSALTPVSSQPLPPPSQPAPVAVNTAPAPALAPAGNMGQPHTIADAKPLPSAPQKLADARPSNPASLPDHKTPVPARAPEGTLGVLPQSPKLKEGEGGLPSTASANNNRGNATPVPGTYRVQQGDTLTKIARDHGVTTTALKAANGMNDGIVRIGQTLRIPAGGATTVAAATPAKADPATTSVAAPAKPAPAAPETAKTVSYTPPKKSEKTIEQAEQVAAIAPDATGIGKMRWPVRGRVISSYGKGGGKSNDGIDIQVPEGTPVKAAENGVVIYAGDGLKEFGNTVLVRHENGLVTVYGHASELKVSRGEKVKRGQEIAVSGMSGSTDSPRLHFEVRKNSTPVDPSGYLE